MRAEAVTQTSPDWIERHPLIGKGLGGALIFALGMAVGSGYLNTTKIEEVQSTAGQTVAATQAHANRTIRAIEAKIPKGTAGKTEAPTVTPDCVPVHPLPKPSP